MILAFDTYYHHDNAKTLCFCFEQFTDETPKTIYRDSITHVAEYEPGSFYKRELPCIIHLIEKYHLTGIDLIIVDGFVVLDDTEGIGLGGYVYNYFDKKVPVIGVAKNRFRHASKCMREIYRGRSRKPLYITAMGIDCDKAATMIQGMKGSYRIPSLLKQLDRMTRENF